MSSAPSAERPTTAPPRRPEKKFGPFHGGVGLAIWLNRVEGESGPRFFRSVTLGPRRYRDTKTGEWMDAGSLRSTDLPALILALQAAHDYMTTTPLPGEPVEEEVSAAEDPTPPGGGEVPF